VIHLGRLRLNTDNTRQRGAGRTRPVAWPNRPLTQNPPEAARAGFFSIRKVRRREKREKQPTCGSPNDSLGTIFESYDFAYRETPTQLKASRKSLVESHHRCSVRPHCQRNRRRPAGTAFKSVHVSLLQICFTPQARHSGMPSQATVQAFPPYHIGACRHPGEAFLYGRWQRNVIL
jgi:hypothetical protein